MTSHRKALNYMSVSAGKVEANLSLCLNKHHATKTYGEWGYSSTHS